ncbi:GNAT family N-acetyltransferase [Halovulum sp. GXIMD14793]
MTLTIRPAAEADGPAIWDILRPVFRAGDTYAVDPRISRDDALTYWHCNHEVFVYCAEDALLGTYYIGPNQAGGGDHVCNCGFATAEAARGQGVARAMLEHALTHGANSGFAAMQFNFVVATNTRAIAIWTRYGFQVVGRLPGAFRHPQQGMVDALVLFRPLSDLDRG